MHSLLTLKMENFPGGHNLELPTKLSPLVTEPPLSQSAPIRVSRSLISVFSLPQEENEVLQKTDYSIPQCYYRSLISSESELKLKASQVGQFSIDSLFYAFYLIPGDVLQAAAAVELHHRGWRYHTELKIWFRQGESAGSVQFDPVSWEQTLFNKAIDPSKFMSSVDYTPRFGSNLGVLRPGPPTRLPPGSPSLGIATKPSSLTR